MTDQEFQNTTDLERVRQIKALLMDLDASVGSNLLTEEDHAAARRIILRWEMSLQGSIGTIRQHRRNVTKKERKPRELPNDGSSE